MLEKMLLDNGLKFATTAVTMEQALLNIAEKGAKPALAALNLLSDGVSSLTNEINNLTKAYQKDGISGAVKELVKTSP